MISREAVENIKWAFAVLIVISPLLLIGIAGYDPSLLDRKPLLPPAANVTSCLPCLYNATEALATATATVVVEVQLQVKVQD